jgi:hypothetical protein
LGETEEIEMRERQAANDPWLWIAAMGVAFLFVLYEAAVDGIAFRAAAAGFEAGVREERQRQAAEAAVAASRAMELEK